MKYQMNIMTKSQAQTTLTLMVHFKALGRPWHMDEWDYIITEKSFLNYDDAIEYLNRYIDMTDENNEDITYDV